MNVQLKRQFFLLHRSSGSVLGLFLFVILFTGVGALGHESLNLWAYFSSFSGEILPLNSLLIQGEKILGIDGFNHVKLPSVDNPIITFCQEMASCSLQLNAQTGEVVVLKEVFAPLLTLHKNLFIGFSGRLFISLFGFVLAILLITGIVIHRRKFQQLFQLRFNKGRQLFLSDLHHFVGLWSYPWLVMFALTGALSGLGAFGTLMLAPQVEPQAPTQVMVKLMGKSIPVVSSLAAVDISELLTQVSREKPNFIPELLMWKNKGRSEQQLIVGGVNLLLPSTSNFEQLHFSGLENHWVAQKSSVFQQFWTRAFIAIQPLHYGQYQWTGSASFSLKTLHFFMGVAACLLTFSGLVLWALKKPTSFVSRLVLGCCNGLIFTSSLLIPIAIFSALSPTLPFFIIWLVTLLFYFFYQHVIQLTVSILRISSVVLFVSALSHLIITDASLWQISNVLLISACFYFLMSLFLFEKE